MNFHLKYSVRLSLVASSSTASGQNCSNAYQHLFTFFEQILTHNTNVASSQARNKRQLSRRKKQQNNLPEPSSGWIVKDEKRQVKNDLNNDKEVAKKISNNQAIITTKKVNSDNENITNLSFVRSDDTDVGSFNVGCPNEIVDNVRNQFGFPFVQLRLAVFAIFVFAVLRAKLISELNETKPRQRTSHQHKNFIRSYIHTCVCSFYS